MPFTIEGKDGSGKHAEFDDTWPAELAPDLVDEDIDAVVFLASMKSGKRLATLVKEQTGTWFDTIQKNVQYKKFTVGAQVAIEATLLQCYYPQPQSEPDQLGPQSQPQAPLRKQIGIDELSKPKAWEGAHFATFMRTLPPLPELCSFQWQRRLLDVGEVWKTAKADGAPESTLVEIQRLLTATYTAAAFPDRKEAEMARAASVLIGLQGFKDRPFAHYKNRGGKPFPLNQNGQQNQNMRPANTNQQPRLSRPCRHCNGWHLDRLCSSRGQGSFQRSTPPPPSPYPAFQNSF